jgi:hypothetical protein
MKERIYSESIRKQGAEENVWTQYERKIAGCTKGHTEKLRNMYYSPNIIRMIKSKRMRWKEHVVCIRRIL